MKLFITILLSLAAAVGLGLLAIEDPGYVVLSRDPYVIRMPLLLFVLIVFVAFMLMYLLFNFIAGLVRAPANYRKWRKQANERSAGKHSMQGFAGLVEGNWSKAESELLKKLDHNQTPLMNYLGAAYAAHQQGHFERRNRYLNDALVAYPKQHLAINLTRSRMLIQSGEFAEARACLEGERKASPKNVRRPSRGLFLRITPASPFRSLRSHQTRTLREKKDFFNRTFKRNLLQNRTNHYGVDCY